MIVRQDQVWTGRPLEGSCYIDGRWVEGQGLGEPTLVLNPSTEETLAGFTSASAAQVSAAVAAARRAFDSGPWSRTTPIERRTMLHRLCDVIEANADELAADAIAEVGTPVGLAKPYHVTITVEILRYFAELAGRGPVGGYERGLPVLDKPFPSAGVLRMEPAGVVAGITAYNFPLPLLARKLGAALASGCTAVIMPSERAPLSTWRFFKLLEQVGYPPGVANLLLGGKEAATALTQEPGVDLISFTGSVAVGREVMRQGALSTKRVLLELGGKSPSILLPGADLDVAVGPTIDRFVIGTGQGCGVTSRTFVHRSDYDAYLDAARSYIGGLQIGDPLNASTQVGPLIRAEHRESVEGFVHRALAGGGHIAAGGGRPSLDRGYFTNPTIVAGVDNTAEIAQSEIFGPIGVLMPYDSIDEAVAMANHSQYGIYASVWGPTKDAMGVARRLSTGTVAINGGGGHRPEAPWGGYRDTGNGRESGEDGFREYFEVKYIEWPL